MTTESHPSQKPHDSGKVPAVIGILPWSWIGDGNNGNIIHAAAARRIIGRYVEYEKAGEWTDVQIDHLRSTNSHLVYVTANLIRIGVSGNHPSIKDLIASQVVLAKNIERAALPVVVFGLGSQTGLDTPSEFAVAPETIRLLKVISDHSRKIAVRGEFTAEACLRLGIKNVEVIGCQSMFWHLQPRFASELSNPAIGNPTQIIFNFTYGPPEAALIRQAIESGFDVIGQGNVIEEEVKTGTVFSSLDFGWEVGTAIKRGLIDQKKYEEWIKAHFYQFRHPGPWLDHMRRYSFSYGTRLHGNMAAMIAGTRALWIVHDMRTKEVCDHFRLPCVGLEDVRNGVNLEALFDRADFSRCMQIYPARYRVLYDYVNEAGLPHSLPAPIGCEEARISSRPIAEAAL
jgi:Polysaccharide pyruvyl transferase